MIGTSLLHYEITAKLGEGGMGVVWQARDTSLDRETAIKVLPQALAQDTERLARFEREAKLLASLNHPNIASVYGLHEAEGERFIAMELVGGEDLSERLARGPVPIDDAIEIALGIARALEAAHSNGVVHRDLKPANIRLSSDGEVKVLDFGLAKAFDPDPGTDSASLSLSPTLTAGHTVAGVILGTAAYMAPEQARGKSVDRRADIWALGVVIFEMLTGKRLFAGDTVSDVLAEVLKTDPDWDALPADTPASLRRLLRRCLRKNPHNRLHDAADARIALQDIAGGLDEPEVQAEAQPARPRPLQLFLAAALGLVIGALSWSLVGPTTSSGDKQQTVSVRRSQIPLPPGKPLNARNSVAISPDGSTLALAAGLEPDSQIYLRRLDSSEMEAIPGAEGGVLPFFSPDSKRLGFFAHGELKTTSLGSGSREITVLADAPVASAGVWTADGWIYFIFGESRLARVREEGGDREVLAQTGDVYHIGSLPGGRGILLTVQPSDAPSNRKDTATIAVLSPDGSTVTPVFDGGYSARYLPTGHLVFMRGDGLFAVPFDLDRLEASPPAVGVQPNVFADSIWAISRFDTSLDGTLVYAPGANYARTIPTWIDLDTGEEEPLPIPAGVYNTFNLSPDGTQVAIQDASGAQDQIHIYDSRRGTFQRLTLEGANIYPVWSYDGREVFFASSRGGGGYRLYRKPVDGSAPATRLLTEEQGAAMETDLRWPASVTPDGKYLLVFTWAHPVRGGDIWKIPLEGDGDPEPVVATDGNDIIPQISPDGRWLAHLTNRTGNYQVMVRPFPNVEEREWIVSGEEGFDGRWSTEGDAIFYRSGWTTFMEVPLSTDGEITAGVPRVAVEVDSHDAAGSSFAVSSDGRRVLVNKPVSVSLLDETPITLVTGWAGEVARLVDSE
jgi:serine/threonine protein kinase